MFKPVGGRGHRAPYETTHVRIPVPLKSVIEEIVSDYRAGHLGALVGDKWVEKSRQILADSRSRDRAVLRRAFAQLLSISEDELK